MLRVEDRSRRDEHHCGAFLRRSRQARRQTD